MGNKWGEPYNYLALYLEKVSREERAEYRDLWRSAEDPLWVFICVLVSPCMGRILLDQRKSHQKGFEGKILKVHIRPKIMPVSNSQSGIQEALSDYNTKKGLALGKNFKSKLNAALILPNKIKK